MAVDLHTYCALCISRCGCIATVEGDRLVEVKPDPGHPTGSAICVKAKMAPEFVHHQDRLTAPLIRTKPKGSADPGFRPIGWPEALDLAAKRLRTIARDCGAEGVAFAVTTPSGTAVADSFAWIHRLAHAFGSPNLVFATENCNWHKDFTPMLTWGGGIGMPDFAHTGLILLWGFNPTATWLAQVKPIREAKRRGAKIVSIDPRQEGLGRSADLWLGVRPGTDGALALGLCHLLLEGGTANEAFLRSRSDAAFLVRDDTGALLSEADILADGRESVAIVWDELSQRTVACDHADSLEESAVRPALAGRFVAATRWGSIPVRPVLELLKERCAAYPPERVEAITGVPRDDVINLAAWLTTAGPVSFFTWTGTAQHTNATQNTRAINVLYALTGDLGGVGGNVWHTKPPVRDIAGFEWVTTETRAKTLGIDERPLGPPSRGWITTRDLFRTVVSGDPYDIKGLVSFGGNFSLTKPDTRHAQQALATLDFFVMAEQFLTPSCKEADLVLPVASPWEREGLQAGFMIDAEAEELIQLRPAVIPPRGESRSDTAIVFELAKRLGLGERFFGGDPEAGLEHMLEPVGLSPADLRANRAGARWSSVPGNNPRRNRFTTQSGRVEIYSSRLRAAGEDPLPAYDVPVVSPEAQPELTERFPLRLTCAKWPQFCHSQQRQSSSLRTSTPNPLLQIHPRAAAERAIEDGQVVRVETPHGWIVASAKLTSTILPDVVCAQYGWWRPDSDDYGEELNYNRAIDGEVFDPVSGSNALRASVCDVAVLDDGDAIVRLLEAAGQQNGRPAGAGAT